MSEQQQTTADQPQDDGIDTTALRKLTAMGVVTVAEAMQEQLPTRITRVTGGHEPVPIIPQTLEDALRIGKAIVLSGMVPKALAKGAVSQEEVAARVMVVMLKGLELRRPPMWSLANIYVVNNRPCVWGDGALDLIVTHPEYLGHEETNHFVGSSPTDDWSATCTITRQVHGGGVKTTAQTFTWADAKRAQLISKQPWRQYPQRMLKMRARAWAIRDSFSDALAGIGIREELEDIPPEKIGSDVAGLLEDASVAELPPPAEVVPAEPVTAPPAATVVVVTPKEAPADEKKETDKKPPPKPTPQITKTAFIKLLMQRETPDQIAALIDEHQLLLETWRNEHPEIYSSVMEQIDGRRKAKS